MDSSEIPNETALVISGQKGDKQALKLLLTNNRHWLKGLVRSVLVDPNDADDAIQNICLRVISKLHTLREPERFKAWLVVIARREAINIAKKKSNAVKVTEDVEPQAMQNYSVPDNIANSEQYENILAAIYRLPPKYREVFVLRYIDDMPYTKIAEVLGLTITTVQIRLVRARQMLRKTLAGKAIVKVPRT